MSGDESFMQRALEIAGQSLGDPGALPFGAVVVKQGRIVGEGLNRSIGHNDPTSHAEVEAIRDACRRLGTPQLEGCELYTSCEPCSMCVSVMYLAGIERVFYAAGMHDSGDMFRRLAMSDPRWQRKLDGFQLREQVALPVDARSMPAGECLPDAGRQLLLDFEAARRR